MFFLHISRCKSLVPEDLNLYLGLTFFVAKYRFQPWISVVMLFAINDLILDKFSMLNARCVPFMYVQERGWLNDRRYMIYFRNKN